jgi:murein DD-endopeptidase MepM/ murein hydrolase activator NlpD
MTGIARLASIGAACAVIFLVAASRVPIPHEHTVGAIVAGAVMTQPFGCTQVDVEPVASACPGGHFHSGVDLAAPVGTDVHAAMDGTAHIAFDRNGAGLFLIVVSGSHLRALYCHLSAAVVADGAQVTTGQVIGEVGSTGLSTGAHLHFEVQVDGRAIDPLTWLALLTP